MVGSTWRSLETGFIPMGKSSRHRGMEWDLGNNLVYSSSGSGEFHRTEDSFVGLE